MHVAEQREVDVRRPPGIGVVVPGIGARTDGDEAVAAVVVGQGAALAAEVGVERRAMLVVGMGVAPGGIALPDLDQRTPHRPPVLVEHAAGDDDALAERFVPAPVGEVARARRHGIRAEAHAGAGGRLAGDRDGRVARSAPQRGPIGGVDGGGLPRFGDGIESHGVSWRRRATAGTLFLGRSSGSVFPALQSAAGTRSRHPGAGHSCYEETRMPLASSSLAMALRCTSSGPSTMRTVRWCA